jgi:Ca2+-binding RTX toxin-like protein
MARIIGTNGPNTQGGSNSDDRIEGRGGNDELRGRGGADDILGGNGNDMLSGGVGRDDLDGGEGNDVLVGGAGADHLDGGPGSDALFGGSGLDIFEFEDSDLGIDRIADWQDGQDRMNLNDFDFTLAEALSTGHQAGDNVRFDLGAGISVLVLDAQLANFDAGDFIL